MAKSLKNNYYYYGIFLEILISNAKILSKNKKSLAKFHILIFFHSKSSLKVKK